MVVGKLNLELGVSFSKEPPLHHHPNGLTHLQQTVASAVQATISRSCQPRSYQHPQHSVAS